MSGFELTQLRCFVAVSDEFHFGRAAERLNMTQPPLSRQIQVLERILGFSLLERTSRRVKLTPAGSAFLIDAKRILRLVDGATLAARRIASGQAGSIAIGFTAAAGDGFLTTLIARAHTRFADIALTLKEFEADMQLEALLTGSIDLALLRPSKLSPEIECMRVVTEPLVAALPSKDPRLSKSTLRLQDFHDVSTVMYSPDGAPYFSALIGRLFAGAGVAPRYVQHVTQTHSILALVQAGMGAAVVPETATRLRFDDVEFRSLETTPSRPVELLMAWRRDNDNPALTKALPAIRLPVPI